MEGVYPDVKELSGAQLVRDDDLVASTSRTR
jgi:hypothetical protein